MTRLALTIRAFFLVSTKRLVATHAHIDCIAATAPTCCTIDAIHRHRHRHRRLTPLRRPPCETSLIRTPATHSPPDRP
jgi:hypothetical protein